MASKLWPAEGGRACLQTSWVMCIHGVSHNIQTGLLSQGLVSPPMPLFTQDSPAFLLAANGKPLFYKIPTFILMGI